MGSQTPIHILEQRYSKLNVRPHPLEGLLNWDSDSVGLRWGWRICVSDLFPVRCCSCWVRDHTLQNHCPRAPLKISDKWALPGHCWENRSPKEVGPQQWPYQSGSSHNLAPLQFCSVWMELWLKRREQKEDPLCLLAPHSHGQSPSKQCVLPS